MKESNLSVLLGAAFLMATSAIGPGFLTQTTVFTGRLGASFGFVILATIIIHAITQLNVWRIIAAAKKPGQDIANLVLPGLGYFVSALVVAGGLAFNIGNIGGAGLGLNVLFGISPVAGALISTVIAVFIFLNKEAGSLMDKFAQCVGGLMVLLTIYVAFTSHPPLGLAISKTVMPDTIDVMSIVTLVGGSVGGYITFAGGHRLLDAGISGVENMDQVNRSSLMGIGITSLMRILLFLATLGVIAQGFTLDPANPPASVFQLAVGDVGYKIFGIVMWSAAITSVVGCAYTSVSFIRTFSPTLEKYHRYLIIAFILVSSFVFSFIGRPVTVLVVVGALNGLILPIILGSLLLAARNKKIVGEYHHSQLLIITGWIVFVVMLYMGVQTVLHMLPQLLG
ncbi:divalent metal cation transporter [Acidaminococcus sp. NSJ-142]|jgi:Mn2+/Fe2+ NRAMP family transporter|uniref:NRAMP family divalent metal transporter n=1 Tax=Acidaminococcus TaxID=904 RepID=UPI000CF98125|nr:MULTISPECIES: NRAMP family divalent metal transporter [Acidaminococcus]MCD2436611.1 divalent metal cation transporter [Acidaminococcus hominis]MCH4096508.1 divalent metal cation transporter [Acidaminococcus provencensis]RHJ97391.1 divalent metal cation transporter [Acidaminococcus sp. AM05-11]